MSSTHARLALACCLCTAACGEPQLIGLACPPGGCPASEPPLRDCGAEFRTERVPLPPGEILNRCELFTLDALAPVGENGHVYLTGASVMLEPPAQHVDVRLAPAIDEFDDGPVSCERLFARAVAWIPLLTAAQHGNYVDLSHAPLVAASSHRVLINQDMVNKGEDAIDVSVVLDVACAATRPAAVSQSFQFSDSEGRLVQTGERFEVSANCVFDKDVLVWRLYRRTHLISAFSVETLGGPGGGGELVWSSGPEWTLHLEPPRAVARGEGFSWQCTYDNAGPPFEVGGDSPDACALLGFYQLPGGGEDESPERCTR
jgi:hypothetical protein